jgi:hypothetical protein
MQLKYTERLGRVEGAGWYLQLSAWPLGDAFVNGDPGEWRPQRLAFGQKLEDKRGLEILAIAGGINARYNGAIRGGFYDSKTPGAPSGQTSAITVYQLGMGANYWYNTYIRVSVNYMAYHTPGSAVGENLAVVPASKVLGAGGASAMWLHELGTRLAVNF